MSALRYVSIVGLMISVLLMFDWYTIWLKEMVVTSKVDWTLIYLGLGVGVLSIFVYILSSEKKY